MKTINYVMSVFISATSLAIASTPASACTTTTWKKISGNSFADTVRGKDCGGTMTARFTGGFGDTGWIPLFKNGSSNYVAQWGDGQVLTDIRMKTNGDKMTGNFTHRAANNSVSYTKGTYQLVGP